MVHFNWSRGNRLVMPAHPEVKGVFHCSNIVFFFAVVNDYESSSQGIRDCEIECYVPMNSHCVSSF